MSIQIRSLEGDRNVRRDFLDVVDEIFAGDPCYVRPLDMDVGDRIDPKKNPFFDHGEATGWVAYRGGKPVGRITAQIDSLHLERYQDDTGFFGFFDTHDDPEIAEALLREAAEWLKARGMKRMRGPYSLNINEETGCLVDGFDTPPMIMMPHHREYQGGLIEGAGFEKAKDFYAWEYDVGRVPKRAQKAHDDILAMPEVTVRQMDTGRLAEDIRLMLEVYNDAWSDNYGFIPATEREMLKAADDVRLLVMPEITRLVFIDGEVAAVALGLPNVNELIADARGKLLPFGAAKLLWRLRVRGPKSGRLVLLGIRKKWRNVRRYAGLSAYLYVSMNQSGHYLGIKRAELGWTVEDNAPINVGIKLMGGRVYKVYRVYERML
ncbi:MAG TPA: N-acetyltransferase [Polyangiaceae bacterium]|nr:N-acetyltransferase [Polyangiaceae bacterium]